MNTSPSQNCRLNIMKSKWWFWLKSCKSFCLTNNEFFRGSKRIWKLSKDTIPWNAIVLCKLYGRLHCKLSSLFLLIHHKMIFLPTFHHDCQPQWRLAALVPQIFIRHKYKRYSPSSATFCLINLNAWYICNSVSVIGFHHCCSCNL